MKYYLRGFGIGILFATMLFSLLKKPDVMTEEEIRTEAGKLGMMTAQEAEEKRLAAIRETELKWKDKQSDEAKLTEDGNEKEGTEDTTPASGEGDADGTEAGNGEIPEIGTEVPPEDGKTPEDGKQEPRIDSDGESEPETVISFEISKGMSSEGASKALEAAGLVDSAEAFNQFLIENGRQTKLIAGNYEIPADADYGTISDIITGR